MISRRNVIKAAPLAPLALAAGAQGVVAPAPGFQSPSLRRLQRRYVDCRYGQIHVTSTAPSTETSPRPALICLPMSPRSGRDFDELAALMATDRWVHAPDLPGYGGSDAPPSAPALEDYAAALIEGLRVLDYGRRHSPVDFFGQHTGAALGIEIARQAPDLVRRLVFIGVPMLAPEEADNLRTRFGKPRPYFDDPEFLAKAWQKELPTLVAGLSKERMLLRFTEIMRSGLNSAWSFNAVFSYPLRDRIVQVKAPMHAIVLNELLAQPSRDAMRLARKGSVEEMPDLNGAALDFAAPRIAAAARSFLDGA
jgi:pimeloyl-ACP methyl ester carboxylesterase